MDIVRPNEPWQAGTPAPLPGVHQKNHLQHDRRDMFELRVRSALDTLLAAMSMTVAIWKWRPLWPFRVGSLVMRRIAEDRAPFGLARFNAEAFANEIQQRFGDVNADANAPFNVEVCDFTGHRANWIMLECAWSVSGDVLRELVQMAVRRRLHVCSE